ncbi:MAG: sugar ABC transporter substrate-binding protein [marine bacterium B5-7]|nr:MAG: sugar ABC transporter substrate-binding protein [marine bacterium B5-7]
MPKNSNDRTLFDKFNVSRRTAVKTALAGAATLAAPGLMIGRAHAAGQYMDLGSFQGAGIDWRMAEGEEITIAVIPAGYFKNLEEVMPDFRTLTGINARLEMIPPGQIRQKAVLDLSSKTGTYASHAADPMYYQLYVANGWIDPLDDYLNNDKLTDNAWFDYEDIQPGHRGATSVDGVPYGIPFDGEATIQIYRKDVYDAAGIGPADTLEQYASNAAKVHDPDNRLWGCALRGFRGAGQNMYIYPSIFKAYGGEWFDGDRVTVDTPEALGALEYYVSLLNKYAPAGVENWNWPDIADAFGQGTVASYIDAHGSAAVVANPEKSKVVGKIGFARWPKGPSGKRVTSIWNWSFPINGALSEKQKHATWLFNQWAGSREVQVATTYAFPGAYKRTGANRASLWKDPKFLELMSQFGDNYVEATTESFANDTDPDWRPRLPQWPAVGDTMATAIQAALVGQATPAAALKEAQEKIDKILKG